MIPEKKLNFDNLKTEVIEKGICGRCGGCISFCSANSIDALEMGIDGLPRYSDQEKCLDCGLCYLVCPQIKILNEEVKEEFGWKEPIGQYLDIFSVRTTDDEILDVATDGGFVTSLLINMLENHEIDGAIVSQKTGLFSRQPIVATTREELISAAGSHFDESPNLKEVGDNYSSYISVIKTLDKASTKKFSKLAVVGTPCQINTIRKMQVLGIVPSDIIIFTIGLFCLQCFSLDDLMQKDFAQKHHLALDDISNLNIKEQFMLQMKSGITINVPLSEIETIARPACLVCETFSNEFADVAVGGLASPHGYTTVVVRSIAGKKMVADALYNRVIEHCDAENIHKSDVDKLKKLALIADFSNMKRERGKSYLEQIGR